MRKLALAIVLVLVLVGSGLAGMSLTSAGPGSPTLKANGSSAPGTVFVSGSYWTLGAQVDIYMDPVKDPADPSDVAHHVAVVWPSGSKGNFSTSFVVGPTALGEHEIVAVQGLIEVHTLLRLTSTQQVDDRTQSELDKMEKKLNNLVTSGFVTAEGCGPGVIYDSGPLGEVEHVSLTICISSLSSGHIYVNADIGILANRTMEDITMVGIYHCQFDTTHWQVVASVGGDCAFDFVQIAPVGPLGP